MVRGILTGTRLSTAEDHARNGMDIGEGLEMESPEEEREEEQEEERDRLSEADLLKIFSKEVEDASSLQDERQTNQEEATNYFYGRLPPAPSGDASEDMSAFVSTDVA